MSVSKIIFSIFLFEFSLLATQENKNKLTKKGQKLEVSYTLKEFRRYLSLDDNTYKRYNNFRTNVLEVAKKELKKKEIDFQFDYYTIGRGKHKTIVFIIKNIKKQKQKEEAKKKQDLINNSDNINQQLYTDIETTLEKMGFNEKERNQLITNYDEMRLRRNINYTLDADKKNKIKRHIKAFLRSALEKDYAMNTHEKSKNINKTKKKINIYLYQ